MTPTRKTRRVQTRSRNGCLTCRKRHRKCDERRPHCLLCAVDGVECEGYSPRFVWKNYTSSSLETDTALSTHDHSIRDNASDSTQVSVPATSPLENVHGTPSSFVLDMNDTRQLDSTSMMELTIPELTLSNQFADLDWVPSIGTPAKDTELSMLVASPERLEFSENATSRYPILPVAPPLLHEYGSSQASYVPSNDVNEFLDLDTLTSGRASWGKIHNAAESPDIKCPLYLERPLGFGSRLLLDPTCRLNFEYCEFHQDLDAIQWVSLT